MARPSDYTVEIGDKICSLIADGQSLRSICASEDMPDKATFYRWLRVHEELRDNYACAKDDGAEVYADQIADIGARVLEGAYDPQAARVAIDALKWTASKLKPKKYGDRIHTEHSGGLDVNSATEHSVNDELMRLLRGAARDAD